MISDESVLRRIFVTTKDELGGGGWRRLHDEKLHNLYASKDIIRVIKRRRMRYAGHVARIREMRNVYRFLVVKPGGNLRRR
jgi:hypothetical protein